MNFNKILSNFDYQQFNSGDIKLWSSEKLSQFLIWDFVNVFASMNILGKDMSESLPRDTKFLVGKYKKYLFIFNFIDWFFLWLVKLFKNNKSQEKILCQKLKGDFLLQETKKHYTFGLVVQGKQDRLFAIKNFMNYIGTTDLYQYVDNYFKDGDAKYLYKLIKKTENKLKFSKPDYIAMSLDSLPIDRAVLWSAKKLGISTIAVQHGLEDSHIPIFNCRASDYILVWGKYFKDLYIEKTGRRPEDIYILGYPYLIEKNGAKNKNSPYTVCYLGQDYERYNRDLLAIKLETLEQLSLICQRLGLNFIYRPHAGDHREQLQEKLPNIFFTPKKERVEETFRKADIFVSFSSTALVEASMRSKISLQLVNYPIEVDNFEKLGVCSKSLKTINELENYLTKIIKVPDLKEFKINFNNDYIETRYNPAQSFLQIMEEIKKNEKKNSYCSS